MHTKVLDVQVASRKPARSRLRTFHQPEVTCKTWHSVSAASTAVTLCRLADNARKSSVHAPRRLSLCKTHYAATTCNQGTFSFQTVLGRPRLSLRMRDQHTEGEGPAQTQGWNVGHTHGSF